MIFFRNSLIVVCMILGMTAVAGAQAVDNFTIRTQIGSDATPPSTPVLLSATPVAQSQIDLVWSASTDNEQLDGYKVFRDALQIATTTLTSYADTGLSASTLYSYYIQAFDATLNTSTSSNVLATTTFAAVATTTPPQPDSSSGSTRHPRLLSFDIISAQSSVRLSWETNRHLQYELRWGRTTAYELGFVTNEVYKREHQTTITELEAGTTYEYQLIGYDPRGESHLLSEGQFKTLSAPDTDAPTNVANLRATVEGERVLLTWENPQIDDFSHVRIVRSHLFYPTDAYDGFIAYQGSGEAYADEHALQTHEVMYYTVFSYDPRGNVSSGAVVAASQQPLYEIPVSGAVPFDFSFSDIEVLQEDEIVEGTDIDADLPLVFRIAYDKLPLHLKTIIVKLAHPSDASRSFSFMLRINKDKTYYEASLAPLRTQGVYSAVVSVYDHQTKRLHEVRGTYQVKKHTSNPAFTVPLQLSKTLPQGLLLLLWLFPILLALYILHRVRKAYIQKIRSEKKKALALPPFLPLLFFVVVASAASAALLLIPHVFKNDDSLLSALPMGLRSPASLEPVAVAILLIALSCVCAAALVSFFRQKK